MSRTDPAAVKTAARLAFEAHGTVILRGLPLDPDAWDDITVAHDAWEAAADAVAAPLRARIAELEERLTALADDWLAASSRYAHMADDAPTDGLQSLYAGRADTYGVCSSKLRLLALNPNGDRK